MNKFDLGDGFVATCTYSNGSSSFYHNCTLYRDGKRIGKSQAQYYNRTWEAYTYQTVMKSAVKNAKHLSDLEKLNLLDKLRMEPRKIKEDVD